MDHGPLPVNAVRGSPREQSAVISVDGLSLLYGSGPDAVEALLPEGLLRDGLDGLKRSIEQAGLTVHKVEVVNAPAGGAAADPAVSPVSGTFGNT